MGINEKKTQREEKIQISMLSPRLKYMNKDIEQK